MHHVRLTIAADSVVADFAGAGAVSAKVAAIDATLDLLLKLDYAVIVDLHSSDKLFAMLRADPVQGQARVTEAWRALAPLFKPGRSGRLYAELLNEPPLEGTDWAAMQAALLPQLRALLPTTPLILSTGGPQRVEKLTASEPAADKNVLYAVHFYDPFYFTHQGADWIDDVPGIGALRDMPFPVVPGSERLALTVAELRLAGQTGLADKLAGLTKPYGETDVAQAMQALADWSRRTGAPVIIDEFGVYGGRAVKADRIHWLETVVGAAQANCLGWTHWEFRDGFGFVDPDSGKPDPELTKALLGRSP